MEIFKVTNIEFYDTKTGKEIPKYIPKGDNDEEKLEMEISKEKTGYYSPELCPNCGEYYEGCDGHYEINGDIRCNECIKKDERLKLPFFAPEIPNYCEGVTRRIFTFKNSTELYNKIKNMLSDGQILVKIDNCIMAQSIDKEYWWVFGYINNYNMELLNIPKLNYNIYNEDGTINVNVMNKWLNNKDIIKGNEDES